MEYNTLMITGQKIFRNDSLTFGQAYDQNMQPIYEVTAAGLANFTVLEDGTRLQNFTQSSSPDFTSLLPVGDRLFSFVHFESPTPSAIYMLELEQDVGTCQLRAIAMTPVDWSDWGGLWTPCAGSVTPWNTHLGSEEYEPDALAFSVATSVEDIANYAALKNIQAFMRYFGKYPNDTSLEDIKELFLPYRYGHATQLTANPNGTYKAEKLYALGRQSWELPYVMPDNRTVYGTDDGDNTMFTRFVADEPNNLTCGQLYGGNFTQLSDLNGGNFTINWIDLGHACASEIQPHSDNTTFLDIFDYAPQNSTTPCEPGFTSVNTGMLNGAECLRLRPGMEQIASRFETRRYLAYLGGTTEFTKWEGITFSPEHGQFGMLYTAMSRIEGSMEDSSNKGNVSDTSADDGGPNHIRIPWNRCGCVYQLEVDADYVATQMYSLICGNTKNNTDKDNKCDINSIAAPDNLSMMRGHNQMIIGEDTEDHQNDVVWLYSFDTASIRRMQTTPYGSETTSAYWHEDINTCAYWISVVQHPYGESDMERVLELPSSGKAARVGYLGPLRAASAGGAVTTAG
ncbi:hypothetical protein ABBQ32_006440 [Trebouxia sp. C0010 RCD-2024]